MGRPLSELPLPPEATVMVIVRGNEAIPPQRETRIETGDHVHVLVREEATAALATLPRQLAARRARVPARRGPARARGRRRWATRRTPSASPAWPSSSTSACASGVPGALVVLEDGRHALTGPVLLVGQGTELRRYAGERLTRAGTPEERVWWRDVLDALGG